MFQWFSNLFGKSTPAAQTSIHELFDHPIKLDYPEYEREAIVTMVIQPNRIGQVKYGASWWNARCHQNVILRPYNQVKVTGRASATLLYVEPIDDIDQNNVRPTPTPNLAPADITATAELNITPIAPVIPLRRRVNAA